jgi:hypothetical protein
MKAAMTAVKLATVRKISHKSEVKSELSEATSSDKSVKNGSSSENNEDVDLDKVITKEIETVSIEFCSFHLFL